MGMNGNSIIPTDKEHDEHYADHCHECGETFTVFNPRFHEDENGYDYCEECASELTDKNEEL